MAGKGDDRRPSQVSEAELAANWERTFGQPEEPTPRPPRKRCGQAGGPPPPSEEIEDGLWVWREEYCHYCY